MLMTQRSEHELTFIDGREPINSNDGIKLCMSSGSSSIYFLSTAPAEMYFGL